MALKIGINGFGRIGRMVLRSIIENNRKDLEVVAINNKATSEISSFLLKQLRKCWVNNYGFKNRYKRIW